jgi:hypothetical protein
MKSILSFIIIGLFLISFVSSLYAGESMTIQNTLGSDNLNWLVVDNTSILSVLPVVLVNTTNITMTIPADMPPNSFLMVFLENYTQKEVTTIRVSSGGGSSHTITKYINNTEYVNVPVENKTTEYVQNNTIQTVPVTTNKIPFVIWIVLGSLIVIIILIVFMNNTTERRLENNGEYREKKEEFF